MSFRFCNEFALLLISGVILFFVKSTLGAVQFSTLHSTRIQIYCSRAVPRMTALIGTFCWFACLIIHLIGYRSRRATAGARDRSRAL